MNMTVSNVTRIEHSYLEYIKDFLLKVVALLVYTNGERNFATYEPFKE